MLGYDFGSLNILDIAILVSGLNDSVLQKLDTDADLKNCFDNAADEQESAVISAASTGIKFALNDDGEVIGVPAKNSTEEELYRLGVEIVSASENEEELERAVEELTKTTVAHQLGAANANAAIIERLNLRNQFQPAVTTALMRTKKQAFISALDEVARLPESARPFPPQPRLRAFLASSSL